MCGIPVLINVDGHFTRRMTPGYFIYEHNTQLRIWIGQCVDYILSVHTKEVYFIRLYNNTKCTSYAGMDIGFKTFRYDLKVCDDSTLVQILRFWTLSIVLCLSKASSCLSFLKHSVSDKGFCIRLRVIPQSRGSKTVRRGAPANRGLFTGAPQNIVKAS
jgi:hypothetical protein